MSVKSNRDRAWHREATRRSAVKAKRREDQLMDNERKLLDDNS
jgi:hypothetical protein